MSYQAFYPKDVVRVLLALMIFAAAGCHEPAPVVTPATPAVGPGKHPQFPKDSPVEVAGGSIEVIAPQSPASIGGNESTVTTDDSTQLSWEGIQSGVNGASDSGTGVATGGWVMVITNLDGKKVKQPAVLILCSDSTHVCKKDSVEAPGHRKTIRMNAKKSGMFLDNPSGLNRGSYHFHDDDKCKTGGKEDPACDYLVHIKLRYVDSNNNEQTLDGDCSRSVGVIDGVCRVLIGNASFAPRTSAP